MSDEPQTVTHDHAPLEKLAWYRQRVVLFVAGSIGIAFLMVVIAMALYDSSGAAKLDLSRPGNQSIQDKLHEVESFESFPADGTVDKKTLDQFRALYDKQTKQVNSEDAFSGSAFTDQALGIDASDDDSE